MSAAKKKTLRLRILTGGYHAQVWFALLLTFPALAQDRSPNWKVPVELGDQNLAPLGVLDVTGKPFSADPTGKSDSTDALQRAIDFARDHQMVAYFPSGTYRVSDTLRAVKVGGGAPGRQLWDWSRLTPCLLVGARGKARPKILLSPHSSGFENPAKPKDVIRFWSLHD